MLVYAKKSLDSLQEKQPPQPPPKVLEHVQMMNDDHTAACQQFEERCVTLKLRGDCITNQLLEAKPTRTKIPNPEREGTQNHRKLGPIQTYINDGCSNSRARC